jgi:dihydrofolate reductase
MRKIFAQFFISLDGVIESPENWHFAYWNDQMQATVNAAFERAETLLLGRKTYEIFADSWPHSDAPLADRINSMPKLVASTTLETVEWQNSRLLSDELTELKRQPGGDIFISGSTSLVRSLWRDGVLDELQLLVHPIVLGTGEQLFANDGADHKPLKLVDSTTFTTGVLHLTYHPIEPGVA